MENNNFALHASYGHDPHKKIKFKGQSVQERVRERKQTDGRMDRRYRLFHLRG